MGSFSDVHNYTIPMTDIEFALYHSLVGTEKSPGKIRKAELKVAAHNAFINVLTSLCIKQHIDTSLLNTHTNTPLPDSNTIYIPKTKVVVPRVAVSREAPDYLDSPIGPANDV